MRCGGDFVVYEIWGAISVSRGAILQVKTYTNVELIPPKKFCYFEINAFDAFSTPWFVTKVIKHITDWSRIKLTSFCITLHCTHYPRPLRLSLVGSQALRFSRNECAGILLSLMSQ